MVQKSWKLQNKQNRFGALKWDSGSTVVNLHYMAINEECGT